jgi:creatinine amidohydrolase/Fe(II)-dependent formamide hydrolase-like protein
MLAAMPHARVLFGMFACALAWGQVPTPAPDRLRPDPNAPRPIDAVDSVFLEELTWMEVRDAMRAGKTTAILATGGIEQNGPYLALGKHNYVLRATTEAIARKLGNALIAPIVAFVPEGDIDPPTGHMLYPGSITVRQETFKALLTDIAASLKTHGFRRIVLLADSGGNVQGMQEVAAELTRKWRGRPAIHYIAEYYDYPGVTKYLESLGVKQMDEGIHDDFGISSIIVTVNPDAVRMKQRMAKNKLTINGVSLAPPKSVDLGRRVVEYRADVTVAAIQRAFGK